jgi:hypothetical protein
MLLTRGAVKRDGALPNSLGHADFHYRMVMSNVKSQTKPLVIAVFQRLPTTPNFKLNSFSHNSMKDRRDMLGICWPLIWNGLLANHLLIIRCFFLARLKQ